MPTKELYLEDCYIKEFTAKVIRIEENKIVLDQTAFYPWGGGLENDTGKIIFKDKEYKVIKVERDKTTREIIHYLDTIPEFKEGDTVKGVIDWERRYRMMRLHTAAHIIAAILYKKYNALITGGHITPEMARDDFNISVENWKEAFKEVIEEANKIVKQGIEVKIYFLPREEALKIQGIVKLASRMPPEIKELRIVEIPGVDIQADGGPHVKNTKEIGEIELIKLENRGKTKKRIYYTVKP